MKVCYNCGNNVGDTFIRCPMCGCLLQGECKLMCDLHRCEDFPRNYGGRRLVLGLNYLIRVFIAFVLGNIVGGIAYLMYRKRYNQSIGYYRISKYDMAYACRTKMHIYLAIFILSIPINYVVYIVWSVKNLFGLLG